MSACTGYMGVDPGLSGAIARVAIDARGCPLELLVEDMPVHRIERNGRKNTAVIDTHRLADLLREWGPEVRLCVIEEVGAMPKQGVASTFTFGRAFGNAEMAVAAAGIPVRYLQPRAWKAHYRLGGKSKDASRQAASRLLPRWADRWARVKDDGRAEAVLMAMLAARLGAQ